MKFWPTPNDGHGCLAPTLRMAGLTCGTEFWSLGNATSGACTVALEINLLGFSSLMKAANILKQCCVLPITRCGCVLCCKKESKPGSSLGICMWSWSCQYAGRNIFLYNMVHKMSSSTSVLLSKCTDKASDTSGEQSFLLCSPELSCASFSKIEKLTGWETSAGWQRCLLYR